MDCLLRYENVLSSILELMLTFSFILFTHSRNTLASLSCVFMITSLTKLAKIFRPNLKKIQEILVGIGPYKEPRYSSYPESNGNLEGP